MTVNRSVVGEENDTTENTDQNERVAVNYGLDLAARTNFPAKYVEKAKQIAKTITKNDSNIVEVNQLDHLCNQTIISLKKLGKSGLKDGELTEELRRLKSLFLETSSELPEVVAKRVNKDTSQQDFENKLNKEKVDNSESLDYSIDVTDAMAMVLDDSNNFEVQDDAVKDGAEATWVTSRTANDISPHLQDENIKMEDIEDNLQVETNSVFIDPSQTKLREFADRSVIQDDYSKTVEDLDENMTSAACSANIVPENMSFSGTNNDLSLQQPEGSQLMEGIMCPTERKRSVKTDISPTEVSESVESQSDVSGIRIDEDENMASNANVENTIHEDMSLNANVNVSTSTNSPCKAEVNQVMEMNIDASNATTSNLKTSDIESIFHVVDVVEANSPDVGEKKLVDSDIEIEF